MPEQENHESGATAVTRLLAWWRRTTEMMNLPRGDLDRMAREMGMTSGELQDIAAKGPDAADLLYRRMAVLGLSQPDVDHVALGLMRELQRDCACCSDKGICRKDLAEHPEDPAWMDYCPNAITLDAMRRTKGRAPI